MEFKLNDYHRNISDDALIKDLQNVKRIVYDGYY